MLNSHDILETINMIDNENLDVRTITMGISLLDCIDPDANRACDKIYDKICRYAQNLVKTGEDISKEYGIPAVAHLTALYSDKAKIDEALDMFEEAGVSAVLALRGDYIDGEQLVGEFNHASDLVSYIRSVKPDFKVFGACYPEGHYQADSLDQDIENLKIKVDAGVTHLISQLFYDNEDFYRFLDKARAAGITVPIEAGIMPVRGAKSVRRMAERNASRIPDRLNTLLNKWGDDIQSLRAAGILYASEQIADLVAHDVDGVHLYSMNHPATTRRIWRNAEPLFRGTQG